MMVEFGLQLPQHNNAFPMLLGTAKMAEEFGFNSVWAYDHLFWDEKPLFEGFTTLAALAEETKRLKLGTVVLANPNRHLSLLAKMASTLDVISGGRLILGLGVGGMRSEHAAYGIPFQGFTHRVGQLREALQGVNALWTRMPVTSQGEHYSLHEAHCQPKPLQEPHPPIMVGGGNRSVLTLAAEHADLWNLWNPTLLEFQRKVAELRAASTLFRRQKRECKPSVALMAVVGEDKGDVRMKMRKHFPRSSAHDDAYFPRIVGPPEIVSQSLELYIDAGASLVIFDLPDLTKRRTLRLMQKEILSTF